MTANRRIFLNIVATYGRSLYALIIGLFCGRWTLMALGEVDYGLIGVVGGLMSFVMFATWMLGAAVGRYYGVSVGKMQVDYDAGLDECRKWFSVAVAIYTVLPIMVFIIGYPVGIWAVEHFLNIPADRVAMCVWVWRFVCLSTVFGLAITPFSAMYTAKQYIAELTIYSFVVSTLNACFQYYMVTHPGVWLVKWAFWTCLMSIAPNLIISLRAYFIFPECRFSFRYLTSFRPIREFLSFSIWHLFSSAATISRTQGIVVLVNKYFGPAVNAAYAIGGNVSGHVNALSASLVGAFSPAIMNAYGAKDIKRTAKLVENVSKFGTLCVLAFAIPLCLEIQQILELWLVHPPAFTAGLCVLILIIAVVDKMTGGYGIVVTATGKVAAYNIVYGVFIALALPFAWIFLAMGLSVYWVAVACLISEIFNGGCRLWFARKQAGVSIRRWISRTLMPILIVSMVCLGCGILPRLLMEQSCWRVAVTTLMTMMVFAPLVWFVLLDGTERKYIIARVKNGG